MIPPPRTTTPPEASRELAVKAASGFRIQRPAAGLVRGEWLGHVRFLCPSVPVDVPAQLEPCLLIQVAGRVHGAAARHQSMGPAPDGPSMPAECDRPDVTARKHGFHIAKLNFQKTMAQATERC